MKYLGYLVWLSGIVGGLLILIGIIAYVFDVRFFGVNHVVNYFHVANSFLLLAIGLMLLKKMKNDD